MADQLHRDLTPHVLTFASTAVRVCQSALDAGVDLRGAEFTLFGEPVTTARLAMINQAGARAVPYYTSVESGHIGHGCLAPEAPDDLHILNDYTFVRGDRVEGAVFKAMRVTLDVQKFIKDLLRAKYNADI